MFPKISFFSIFRLSNTSVTVLSSDHDPAIRSEIDRTISGSINIEIEMDSEIISGPQDTQDMVTES